VGPESSGKVTVCKILTNYASRMHRHPLLVNADPSKVGEQTLSLPACSRARQ
jgi:hypothetical protein